MAYVHKPGTFSLFKNDKKTDDKHPDYKGYGKDAAGNDIDVAAWLQQGSKGRFMSCKLQPKREQQAKPATRTPVVLDDGAMPIGNDIPW